MECGLILRLGQGLPVYINLGLSQFHSASHTKEKDELQFVTQLSF